MPQTNPSQEKVDIADIIDDAPFGKFHVLVMLLCGLIAMLDGFDTQSIAFVAPVIGKSWALKAGTFGPIFAAGLFGLMIGQFFLGPVSDRFGRRLVILLSTLVFGVFTLMTAYASNVPELLTLRLLTGIGLGGAMPNIIALTSEFAPKKLRATMVTIMFGGFPLGAVIGGYISSFLIPAYGWQSVFYLGGIVPLVLLVVLYFTLPESVHHHALSGKHNDKIRKTLARVHPKHAPAQDALFILNEPALSGLSFQHLFLENRATKTLLLWVSYFMSLLMIYFLMLWLPSILTKSGMTLDIGIKSAVFLNLGGMIGGVVIGQCTDRFNPFTVLASGYALAGLCIASIGFVGHSTLLLMCVVFMAGFFVLGAQTAMNAVVTSLYPARIRSTGLGSALAVGRIGSIVGPVAGGILLAAALPVQNIFIACAVPTIIACLALLLLKKNIAKQQEN